jgi:hypothetical protein
VARSWQGLALFFVLGNILFGLQTTAFITVISDSVTPKRRLAAFSYYQLWSSLSFVAGPILGAFVVLPYLTTSCYLALTGGAYLAMGIVRLLWIREPRPLPAGTPPRVARPHAVRTTFLSPERRLLMVLTAGTTLVFALTINGPFLALAARTLDHIPLRSIDFLFGLGAVGALIAGFVATRMGTAAKSLAFGLIGIAVAGAALAFPMSPPAVLGGYVLAFAGYQVATIAFSTLRVELAGATNPGEVLGATSALAGLIAFLGLILGGALGSRLALLLASFCAASTALWAVRLVETGGTLRTAEGRPGYLSPTEDVSH